MASMNRRDFIQRMLALGGTALAASAFFSILSCARDGEDAPDEGETADNTTTPARPTVPAGEAAYLAVVRDESPSAAVQKCLDALGGIQRFVKSGNDVIIKPNICTANRAPEYACTTNPEVVAALVSLCLAAGASRVRVMDKPFDLNKGGPQEAYDRSGISEAVKQAGGEMEVMADMKFQQIAVPDGKSLKYCDIYKDILQTDVFINVPIAKHHGNPDAVLTLGMKNLLGVVSNPGTYHTTMAERVTDLNSLARPTLTVIDAIRVRTANGPTGSDLDDVVQMNTVIASHDTVAADSYGATLFGKTAQDLPIVRAGAARGLGTMDLASVKVEKIGF